MLWVDHQSYFGPDRRRAPPRTRLRERRRENYAGNPPPLSMALRQLRLRTLDAHQNGVDPFISRTRSVALLAEINGEPEAANVLASMALNVARGRGGDMRPIIYHDLDRAHAALRAHH